MIGAKYLTDDEIKAFMAAIPTEKTYKNGATRPYPHTQRDKIYFNIMLKTGVRSTEALAPTWGDVLLPDNSGIQKTFTIARKNVKGGKHTNKNKPDKKTSHKPPSGITVKKEDKEHKNNIVVIKRKVKTPQSSPIVKQEEPVEEVKGKSSSSSKKNVVVIKRSVTVTEPSDTASALGKRKRVEPRASSKTLIIP